jgi:hypothetical protein
LDLYIKGFEPWKIPEIPLGYRNQSIFAFPAQLRQRNPGGGAVVAGAPIYVALPVAQHEIGPMDRICIKCNARKFKGETPGIKFSNRPGICCRDGKISLPLMKEPPPELFQLFTSQGRTGKLFRDSFFFHIAWRKACNTT